VVEVKGVHESKEVKQLDVSRMICSINKQNDLVCIKNTLGEFKMVIPPGLDKDVKKVVSGVTSTAIIDTKGNLRFWFN